MYNYIFHTHTQATYMYHTIRRCNSWIQDCNSSVWVTKDQRESGWRSGAMSERLAKQITVDIGSKL